MIAEIIGPSGRIHYRRPPGDALVDEALRTPGYTVRLVETETQEPYTPAAERFYPASATDGETLIADLHAQRKASDVSEPVNS